MVPHRLLLEGSRYCRRRRTSAVAAAAALASLLAAATLAGSAPAAFVQGAAPRQAPGAPAARAAEPLADGGASQARLPLQLRGLGAAAGVLAAVLALAAGHARAETAVSRQDLYYGQMVFGFKISDCDAVRRGAEPLCDDIEDWSRNKPFPPTPEQYANLDPDVYRVARWRSLKVPKGQKTVTETLDDKCIAALAKLVNSGPYDGGRP